LLCPAFPGYAAKNAARNLGHPTAMALLCVRFLEPIQFLRLKTKQTAASGKCLIRISSGARQMVEPALSIDTLGPGANFSNGTVGREANMNQRLHGEYPFLDRSATNYLLEARRKAEQFHRDIFVLEQRLTGQPGFGADSYDGIELRILG
jgi:hypothetical protein